MKTVSKRLTRSAPVLVLLLSCAPVIAAGVVAPALGGVALLGAALAICAFQLVRSNVHDQRKLAGMQALLSKERSARAESGQALADAHAVLCKLVREQAGVRDAERSRIARDIHDDLGQNLLALRIELSLMQVATSGIHPAIHQKIGVMAHNLDLTIRSLRAVINNLRPLALGEGLRPAIERQLAEFSRINGIAHTFEATDPAYGADALVRDTDAMLYRILQESLSNVARHAHASLVCVALGCDGGRLTLRVTDNGVGMQAAHGCGCGLNGIRERVGAAGGQLVIDSAPGAGMTLSVSIPLPQAAVAS